MRILLLVCLLPSSVPQQKLPEPLAGAMPVLDSGFALPHQVAQGFVVLVGNPYRSQISTAIAARQLRGVAAIGLDPFAGLGRNQRWRDHLAGDTQLRQLPVQPVASGSGFIAGTELHCGAELSGQLPSTASGRFGMIPRSRISPPGFATATAIVSAWTSSPT
jgi:hypothetical protein